MTSSSEELVIRADRAGLATPLSTPDLSTGAWTRWGAPGVRGDAVTEDVLATLADRTRAAAQAQGYAVGWAKGVREAEAAAREARAEQEAQRARDEALREAEHTAAVSALRAAALRLEELTASTQERLGAQATELAFAVTAEVLGTQAAAQPPEDVVRRALAVLPDRAVATVRLHPSVARSAITDLAAGIPAGISVVADSALGPADALVELSDHVIDLRIDQALARLREVLS
jgi:flagellar assembly protein FliH